MSMSYLIRLCVVLLIAVCESLATPRRSYQQPLSPGLELRNATTDDTEAVTKIILAVFHDSPHFKYCYQFMDQYPGDHHDCFYSAVREALEHSRVLAQIVLMPNSSSPHDMIPVAVAIWQVPSIDSNSLALVLFPPSVLKTGQCFHRDLNMTRAIDYEHQFTVAKWKYLDSIIPDSEQFYLNTLATHPEYQRRGAGGALVRSGLKLASTAYREENITATLIATVAGELLYTHLGWQSLANFTIKSLDKIDGEKEKFRFNVMKYDL